MSLIYRDGVAYLDLDGNRIDWSKSNGSHEYISLFGHRFHNALTMTALIVACLAGFAFLVLLVFVCCVRLGSHQKLKYLTVAAPIFCMIWYARRTNC